MVEELGLLITIQEHKSHWKLRASKLKYSFRATGIEEKLQCLRALDQSFCLVSQQTISLASHKASPSQIGETHPAIRDEYKAIQKACGKLYKALSMACGCHEQHSIHVHLDTQHDLKPTRTHFRLGLKSGAQQKLRWIRIDSEPLEATTSVGPADQVFGVSSLFDKQKICDLLEQHFKDNQRISVQDKYLGDLGSDSDYRHLLYFAPEQFTCDLSDTRPLSYFMSPEVRVSHSGKLSSLEKIRLARQLSMAMLHFESTPVMRVPRESGNVVFLGGELTSVNGRRSSLGVPHLNVQIHKSEVKNSSSAAERALIQNPHLSGLAIVLLELAYETSLRELDTNSGSNAAYGVQLENHIIADTQSQFVGEQLGLVYQQVVRKCLTCDFGHGKDLSNPRLQAAFYEEVVCKLEDLEKSYGKRLMGFES